RSCYRDVSAYAWEFDVGSIDVRSRDEFFDRYEIPASSPCENTAPDQLRIDGWKNNLAEISEPTDTVGTRYFLNVRGNRVNPCNDSKRRGPGHCCEYHYDRRELLTENPGKLVQDEKKHDGQEPENRDRLENIE